MDSTIKAHLALFAVALIYGANYTIAKEVMNNGSIQPLGFILLRVISGFLFFSLIHRLLIREKVEKKDFGLLMLCGLFGVAINQMFFFSGLELTRQINAALIMTVTPVIVLVASAILIGERITFRKLIGILLGGSGAVLLISFNKEIDFDRSGRLGDLMILVNAISYGVYIVLVKSLLRKYHPFTVIKWVFTFGLIAVFPFGFRQLGAVEWSLFSFPVWTAVLYVIIGTTILAYLLNIYALGILNPSTVSIYIYLQPLIAAAIALYLGKDELTWVKFISGLLIFYGVYLVSIQKKRLKKADVTN